MQKSSRTFKTKYGIEGPYRHQRFTTFERAWLVVILLLISVTIYNY